MQNLTLAPLAPLDPCKRKERSQAPRGADPSPHHAAIPMPAQPQVWVFLHPCTPPVPPLCTTVHKAWCLPAPRSHISLKLVVLAGCWCFQGGWMHRPGRVPSPDARQPLCAARQRGGHQAPPMSLLHSPFLLDFLCHPSDERREEKQRMKTLAARGPSRSHACQPAAPRTFIPW